MRTLRNLLFIAPFVVGFALIMGCSDDAPLGSGDVYKSDGGDSSPVICTGTVYGYDRNTGTYYPLSGARVAAYTWPYACEFYGDGFSKSDGTYVVKDLPTPPWFNSQGQWTVLICSKWGYSEDSNWNAWCPGEFNWVLTYMGDS
jgi:hypothetical protein